MRQFIRASAIAALVFASAAVVARAQSKTLLPFDHIHLNEPAAESSQWWEKNIPGGRRITESPNRIMYGAVRLMFLTPRSSGGSDGSVIEHLGFSVADLDQTMGSSVPSQGRVIDHIGWRSLGTINETKATLEGKQVRLTSQPSPLNLPNGPSINFFYVAGPAGTRIELGERPGLKPGE